MNLHRTPGLWLLHAIAAEIDRRQATVVPDSMVCRACGGRGEAIVALDQGRFIDPAFMSKAMRGGWMGRIREGIPGRSVGMTRTARDGVLSVERREVAQTRMVVIPCNCPNSTDANWAPDIQTPATRPDTVSLAWLVAYLAEQRTPAFDFPVQWLVDIDQREAAGDGSWQAVWWAQFWAWSRGLPLDVERLNRALAKARPNYVDPVRSRPNTSIEAAVLTIHDVTNVLVLENRTSEPDARWYRGHWVEVIVEGGLDTEIAEAIYLSTSLGTALVGTTAVTVEGATGLTEVRFSRPNSNTAWSSRVVQATPDLTDPATIGHLRGALNHIPARVVGIAGCRVTHTAENVAHVVLDTAVVDDFRRYAITVDGLGATYMPAPGATSGDVLAGLAAAIGQSPANADCVVVAVSDGFIVTLPPRVRVMSNPEASDRRSWYSAQGRAEPTA